jgi:hypothetical protein
MKRVIHWIVGLYPACWRRRYGVEFDALLGDIRPGWPEVIDLLRGAIEMQIAMGTVGKSLAIFGVAGALIAGAVSLTISDKYRSSILIRVQQAQAVTREAYVSELEGVVGDALDRKSLLAIMEKENLYERERARKPMDDVIHKMRNDISIRLKGADALEVSFDGADAARARETTAELVAKLIGATLHRREAGTLTMAVLQRLEVQDEPTTPQRPVSPNRIAVTGFGLGAGLLLGALAAWVRRPTHEAV